MRVVILGAGAIGAFVGASLANAGTEVVLVARGAHLDAMQRRGVTVLAASGESIVRVEATSDLDAIRGADVVFVALKANSLPAVAPEIGKRLGSGAMTVWAQNGLPWWYFQSEGGPFEGTTLHSVDPAGVIGAAIDADSVIGCVTYCSTELVAPGVIRHVEGNRFSIGEPGGALSTRLADISTEFAKGNLKAPPDARLRDQIWLKLVGNAAFNPISALTRSTLGELGTPGMRDLLQAVFAEVGSVAAALGVRLPVSLERRLEAGIAVGDHKTSMLQDLEAGKPLEIDCMTGAVIELASLLGLAVPHVASIHACVSQLDRQSRLGHATSGSGS